MLEKISPELIGTLAGLVTTACYLPQIIKLVKTRHAADISTRYYLILATGLALWVLYGVLEDKWPIIAMNLLSITFIGVVLALKYRYRPRA